MKELKKMSREQLIEARDRVTGRLSSLSPRTRPRDARESDDRCHQFGMYDEELRQREAPRWAVSCFDDIDGEGEDRGVGRRRASELRSTLEDAGRKPGVCAWVEGFEFGGEGFTLVATPQDLAAMVAQLGRTLVRAHNRALRMHNESNRLVTELRQSEERERLARTELERLAAELREARMELECARGVLQDGGSLEDFEDLLDGRDPEAIRAQEAAEAQLDAAIEQADLDAIEAEGEERQRDFEEHLDEGNERLYGGRSGGVGR